MRHDLLPLRLVLGDGAMFLFHLYIQHANPSAVYKLQLRNKLEHMVGLFVRQPIQKTIYRLISIVDDAIRFNINVDYELSVKATVNTLVHEQPSCSREWPRSELEGFRSSKMGPRRSTVLEGLINPSLRHRKSAARIRNPPNTSPRVSREGHKRSTNGGWSTCSNHDRRRCAGAVGAASLQTKIIPRRRPIAECTVVHS